MAERRYYWLKLKGDFFQRHDIRILEKMQGGSSYVIFYLKLLTESLAQGGRLRFSEDIPLNWEMLSAMTGLEVDEVGNAMKTLSTLGMIQVLPDETILIPEYDKLWASESASAHRMRKVRRDFTNTIGDALQNQKNVTQGFDLNQAKNHDSSEKFCKVKASHCDADIDIDKDIEIEIDIESDKKAPPPAKGRNAFLDMLREERMDGCGARREENGL
jgi:predicted phage replisome organizer